MTDMDLLKLSDLFPDETHCRAALEKLRWPNGVRCLRCESDNIRHHYTRDVYDCGSCGYQFTVISGTIFHDTHLPLRKWFVAMYLMCESKKGISANQMKRTLNVAYKTAWYLCHRIRAAMSDASAPLLKGIVEVDETWVGGKRKNVGHGYRDNKTMVLGAIERGGPVRMKVGSHATRKELHAFIRSTTADNAEAIYTDDWPAYRGIGDANTRHETVNHSIGEYVRGAVHTNSIENVWSLLDRSVIGAFHHVSEKHLDRYLDELEWRFNNRENPFMFTETLRKLLASENLEYKELITKS